ncbi:hypothetical protein FB45DRAFT_1055878 [Roridomyces roridus]|uniref:F-box domain-containing protein n=1 Tax=Roridomyces roridus TaxID=1738132 RepID=A0AAD7C1A9_9AGAR|nr:hypothetical protein FB45DRAFT_1055878 [Roridomyces roridus]
MSLQGGPLHIPELLDLILSFVHAPRDLRRCALVNRSCAHPAQSRLFSSLDLRRNSQCDALSAIFATSPHLAGFVTTLVISAQEDLSFALRQLLAVSFPFLTTIRFVADINVVPVYVVDLDVMRSFLGIPTLISVTVETPFKSWDEMGRIWNGCSPNIKHLSYDLMFTVAPSFTPSLSGSMEMSRRIKLDSLNSKAFSKDSAPWRHDPGCPFDVSGLKAFGFHFGMTKELVDVLSPSLDTIKILSLDAYSANDRQVSRFRAVTQLNIRHYQTEGSRSFNAIRVMHPDVRNRISAIRFQVYFSGEHDLLSLDAELGKVHEYFPRLQTVVINLHPSKLGTEEFKEEFKQDVRAYRWNPDPGITVRCNFESERSIPWHTEIV